MNLERGDDKWTCPHCGERHYPEVGMSFCGCGGSYTGNRFDDDEPSTVQTYSTSRATTVHSYSTYEAPPLVLPYAFIKHQTEKAILFAMQDNNGIYQQWIPRSVILAMTLTQVTIKAWFKSRLL